MFSSEEAEGKAVVFWDIEDYKIPDGLDAAEVSRNIKTYLADMGHRGEVIIKAYADKTNRIKANVFHSVGIKLKRIPEGSDGKNSSRDNAILVACCLSLLEILKKDQR